jgi:hypothetical protein
LTEPKPGDKIRAFLAKVGPAEETPLQAMLRASTYLYTDKNGIATYLMPDDDKEEK